MIPPPAVGASVTSSGAWSTPFARGLAVVLAVSGSTVIPFTGTAPAPPFSAGAGSSDRLTMLDGTPPERTRTSVSGAVPLAVHWPVDPAQDGEELLRGGSCQ